MAADPEEVWAVLADFGSISSWAPTVEHSCLLSPAGDGIGLGTSRRVQVGRDALVERITEFTSPRALAYDVEGFPRQLRHLNNRWTLSPAGGGTVVTLTTTFEIGPNPLQRLAERAVARFSSRQLDTMLTGLTRRLETA